MLHYTPTAADLLVEQAQAEADRLAASPFLQAVEASRGTWGSLATYSGYPGPEEG